MFLLSRISRYLNWKSEIRLLDNRISTAWRPKQSQLMLAGNREPIWRINTPRRDVFMSLPIWARDDDLVVHVHSLPFHRAWLASGLTFPDSCPLQADLTKDRKYPLAEDGFAGGELLPVPIADVSLWPDLNGGILRFSDGVTRTLWLIANEAETFPVLCSDRESADTLSKIAGIGSPISVGSLNLLFKALANRPPDRQGLGNSDSGVGLETRAA